MSQEPVSQKIRIMLVDDHVLMRMGLAFAINNQPDMEVVAEAEDGAEAVSVFRIHLPDLVVLDLRMPKKNGIQTIGDLKREFGTVRVLILSNYSTAEEVSAALDAGAAGFVVKDTHLAGLVEGIRSVNSGLPYLSPEIGRRLAGQISARLSPREQAVLQLIGKGLSNKEIGAALDIAEKTVKVHVTSLLSKLGVADRTQAILAGIKRGMIHVE